MIIFSKIGFVTDGQLKGLKVTILDDTNNTGGYDVLYWTPLGDPKYSNWYESYEALLVNIEDDKIQWTDEDYISQN